MKERKESRGRRGQSGTQLQWDEIMGRVRKLEDTVLHLQGNI